MVAGMSACDRCFQPGACCKGFHLTGVSGWMDEGRDVVEARARESLLPFHAVAPATVYNDPESGKDYQTWTWNCPKVSADGRCTIYDTRPDLCRNYAPASDGLCVHFGGAEGIDLTPPANDIEPERISA